MEALDQQDDGAFRRELGEERDPRLVQPVTRRERVEIAGEVEAEREPEQLALAESSQDDVRRVAVEDAEVFLEDFSERPVRDPLAVGQAATRPSDRRRLFGGEALPELAR